MASNTFVGKYNKSFNLILGINIEQENIYCSDGLYKHLIKRNHHDSLKYLKNIPNILNSPDYIGINPNETNDSVELVKRYDNNILIGIKVDASTDTLYVSTMYSIQESKLQRRINSGRLKPFAV